MVKLVVYAYFIGMSSSRQIARAKYKRAAMRVDPGNQNLDPDTISTCRQQYLSALASLCVQPIQIYHRTFLVPLGHVAFDRTTLRLHASN